MADLTIGLLWHKFTSFNNGVNALSYANVALIDGVASRLGLSAEYRCIGTVPDSKAMIPCYPPGLSITQVNVEGSKRLLLKPRYFNEKIDGCHAVFDISEGDSFTDIYGWRQFWRMYLTKYRVIQRGIPLILAPQTIGPYKSPLHSWMTRRLIGRCEHVFPRDELSLRWLEERGLTDNTTISCDVAFRLPHDQAESSREPNRVRIGINVSGLMYGGGYTRNNQFGLTADYPVLIRRLIRHFAEDSRNEVWLMGHVNIDDSDAVENDHRACLELAGEIPGVQVTEAFSSPVSAKSFISGLDFFVGARMHATIAAFSSGVPVVPIGYSRKFTGLYGSLDYDWVADATKHNSEEVIARVIEGFEKREDLARQLVTGNQKAQRLLQAYEAHVENTLRRVADGA